MALRDQLTTDFLKNLGMNSFEITNLAIRLIRSHIRAGHFITVEEGLDMIRKKGLQEIEKELAVEGIIQ